MKFALEIGETEKNLVEFAFNQLLGNTVIKVNRRVVKNERRLISEPVRESHRIQVGINEKWEVRIEKKRQQLVGGRFSVFVNDRLINVFQGM
ncbi:MAG TPA: hypothetical protein VNO52_13245 [Methylomirabilota bacterium]|nr:hypothetical protein [Methylomirabilota bacterium]